MAKGRLRNKHEALEKALNGKIEEHHRFILEQLLSLIDAMDKSITTLDEKIMQRCQKVEQAGVPFHEAVTRLDTIPGVGRDTAELIVAEIGTDMSRFPSAEHLCAWAGVASGNNESLWAKNQTIDDANLYNLSGGNPKFAGQKPVYKIYINWQRLKLR